MKIRNNEDRVIALGPTLTLRPGVQNVRNDLWTQLTEKPGKVIQHYLKSKTLEVVDTSKWTEQDESGPQGWENPQQFPAGDATTQSADEGGTASDDLSDYKAEDAISLVSDCLDPDTLKTWRKNETRKTVLEAIDEQIKLTKS